MIELNMNSNYIMVMINSNLFVYLFSLHFVNLSFSFQRHAMHLIVTRLFVDGNDFSLQA